MHHLMDRVGVLSPLEESSAEVSRDSGVAESQSGSSLSMLSETLSSGSLGPPVSQSSPSLGPPGSHSPSLGPPGSQSSPSLGPPGSHSPSLGPPGSQSTPSLGPPASHSPSLGPPGSHSPSLGPPGSHSPSLGPPGSQSTPSLGPPASHSPSLGPPGSHSPSLGPPGSQSTPSLGPPASHSPSLGPPVSRTDQDKDDDILRQTALHYSSYIRANAGDEILCLEKSLEEMLTRVDEFVGMLDMTRSDTSQIVNENLPQIQRKSEEMRQIYRRIDKLETFVKTVGANVNAMEEQVTQAEGEQTTLPGAFKKIFRTMSVPGFLNKTPSPRRAPHQPQHPPTVFRTDDYFPSQPEQ